MRDVVRGHIVWTAFAVWGVFFPMMALIPLPDFAILLGGMNAVAWGAVLLRYWPAAKIALKLPPSELEFADFLTLGIMCTAFAIDGRIIYVTFARVTELNNMTTDYPLLFFQWTNYTAAILHLSARRVIRNNHPVTNWPFILGVIVAGVLTGTALAALN